MKSLASFEDFVETTLRPTIKKQKASINQKKDTLLQILGYFAFVFSVQVFCVVADILPLYSLVIVVFLFLGPYLYFYLSIYDKGIKKRVNDEAVKLLCEFINTDSTVEFDKFIDPKEFIESRLFIKMVESYGGDHLINLKIKDLKLTFSNLEVGYKKQQGYFSIFKGIFGYVELKNNLEHGHFKIYSDKIGTIPFFIKQLIRENVSWQDDYILIPKFLFNKHFKCYGKAVYPLPKHIFSVDAIKHLYELYQSNSQIALNLKDNKCYFALGGAKIHFNQTGYKFKNTFKDFYISLLSLFNFFESIDSKLSDLEAVDQQSSSKEPEEVE